jgi:hypothetical protein
LDPNTAKKIRALEGMTIGELREKYLETFGEATRSDNKRFLIRRIAWQLQALKDRKWTAGESNPKPSVRVSGRKLQISQRFEIVYSRCRRAMKTLGSSCTL